MSAADSLESLDSLTHAIELKPAPEPADCFRRLAAKPNCLFLDSALRHAELGRYSFLSADPFEVVAAPVAASDPLSLVDGRLSKYRATTLPGLPPFQGGAAGLFAYDLSRSLERIPAPRYDEFGAPAMALGLYDVVVAWDHPANRAWIVSQGFPETDPDRRRQRARERAKQFARWLSEPVREAKPSQGERLSPEELAPQFPCASIPGFSSNFSPQDYLRAIVRVVEYITAGDVFQVNLAQRLLAPATRSPVELYLKLRRENPAPFAGYFDLGDSQIASASPERFVRCVGGQVETRPIKGTRRRTARPEADLYAGDDLMESEKDRAENVMIVDLMRNDLSRVCRAESVQVTQLCQLETYQFVQHLVSAVRGELMPDKTALDLVRAAFPAGSITGAPKVRAMEIIAELEPTARGAYCGSLGYLGFDGSLDLSVTIRTITCSKGWLQMPAGGGIVAQSVPLQEYEETWDKAAGLIKAAR